MNNRELNSWKTVEVQLRRSPTSLLPGIPLTPHDAEQWCHGMVIWALILHELWDDRQHTRPALTSWLRQVILVDVQSVITALKSAQNLLRNSQDMGYYDRFDFKGQIGHEEKLILSPILAPLYAYADSPNKIQFRKLNQAITFPLRITLQGTDEVAAKEKFMATQEEIANFSIPMSLISDLRSITEGDWTSFRYGIPKLNSGATLLNQGKWSSPESKLATLQHTAFTHHVFGDEWMPWEKPVRSRCDIVLEVITVPKDAVKKRLVCPDDTTHIFYQAGIADGMEECFNNNPSWGIHLRNQEISRHSCLVGTIRRDRATIDLSEASDRVSWRLVKSLTFGTPLYRYLAATRAEHYCFRGEDVILPFSSFAPMGSRTCFPMESYIFSVVCRYARMMCHSQKPFQVYGDDLIVSEEIFQCVIDVLEDLGMVVNEDKTFPPGSLFLESCGMEAYSGLNVTPVRFPRFYDVVTLRRANILKGKRKNRELSGSTSYASAVEFSNALWCEFHDASQYVRQEIPGEILSRLHRAYADEQFGLHSLYPTNFHLEKRWNEDYQRNELRHLQLGNRDNPDYTRGDDRYRYLMTLMELKATDRSSLMRPDDLISLKVGPAISRNTMKWREDK